MHKYRGSRLIRFGFVGLTLIALVVVAGLNTAKLISWFGSVSYQADFDEAAGLSAGADVLVSGVRVGSVSEVELVDGRARVTFAVGEGTRLGDSTTVQIRTGSLLGQRIVTVDPGGDGTLSLNDVIPVERTASPYSLNEAVDDLTTNTAGIDTAQLNESLDVLSTTLDDVAPELAPTFDGLAELSRGINARNSSLTELFSATNEISGVLSDRAGQINTLLLDANLLLEVLSDRRHAIASLLANTAAVGKQLSLLVADNEKELAPTLTALNSVVAMLERNRDNISEALPGLAKVSQTQGEAVSGGPFYQAYVANLIPGPLLQPFIDEAFGVEPRAKFPIPGGTIG